MKMQSYQRLQFPLLKFKAGQLVSLLVKMQSYRRLQFPLLKLTAGQNIAMHAWPASRGAFVLVSSRRLSSFAIVCSPHHLSCCLIIITIIMTGSNTDQIFVAEQNLRALAHTIHAHIMMQTCTHSHRLIHIIALI